ncbi:hypothetical protein [Frankia sp. AgB32]|uniref:hypothetical protein n=1 Tax=Frankia sp. AgB32 TaxID=631119 RepID=UPI00200E765E|nr:hypothetical protein [Frankia sp. AgB32]MCK9897078.1 hypothetical protein [Frankia sp. AgB32]
MNAQQGRGLNSLAAYSGSSAQTACRAVHFFGETPYHPLREAAQYLEQLDRDGSSRTRMLYLHQEFSCADRGSDLAWRVTLVLQVS